MSLIIEITVAPNSGQVAFKLTKAGTLKCFLKSSPERGKANQELTQILAKLLKVTQADVQIMAGHTSRKKLIKIMSDISFDDVLAHVGIEKQHTLY